MVRNLLTVMLVNLERKQPSAPRAKTSVKKYIQLKIFTRRCSNYALKTKDQPLSRSSKAALNPSVSSMSVMRVGSWFQSLMVLG